MTPKTLAPPIAPMDARLVEEIPAGPGWLYEPKWDGFRCIAFRRGSNLQLQSKSGQPLTRYFPELVDALLGLKADRFVVDGEIAVPIANRFSFDELLQRIHPAESRVRKLATQHPALLILFDLLEDTDGRPLLANPLKVRRQKLEEFVRRYGVNGPNLTLSPATTDIRLAAKWFEGVGNELDGVIAKSLGGEYLCGERSGMQKIKRIRTADCVVGGFRYTAAGKSLGSLLLGLYNEKGLLDHVGFCSGFKAADRRRLLEKLKPLVQPPGFTGSAPGGPSRWSTKRSQEWYPLKPDLVLEVSYDHFTGGRFRHGTGFIRWRPDKSPRQCGFEQIAPAGTAALKFLSSQN